MGGMLETGWKGWRLVLNCMEIQKSVVWDGSTASKVSVWSCGQDAPVSKHIKHYCWEISRECGYGSFWWRFLFAGVCLFFWSEGNPRTSICDHSETKKLTAFGQSYCFFIHFVLICIEFFGLLKAWCYVRVLLCQPKVSSGSQGYNVNLFLLQITSVLYSLLLNVNFRS